MNLQSILLDIINDTTLSLDDRVLAKCQLCKEYESAGEYGLAQIALEGLWSRVGEKPLVAGLNTRATAELLLRAGSLSGWIGWERNEQGAQEIAKDLITQSQELFVRVGDDEKSVECQNHLALCYWREGAYDEARVILSKAFSEIDNPRSEIRMSVALNRAMVERSAGDYDAALRIHNEVADLFNDCANNSLKARFHHGNAFRFGAIGDTDNALIENAAASHYYLEAGHTRHYAGIENNLGFIYSNIGRFQEAHEHLDKAYRMYMSLKDKAHAAQVEETRASTLLAEQKYKEAERFARASVRALEKGDEKGLLVDSLITWGRALARLDRTADAISVFLRAHRIADELGDLNRARQAVLSCMEEAAASSCLDVNVSRDEALQALERGLILRALAQAAGRITHAAKLLKLDYRSLQWLLENKYTDLLNARIPVKKRRSRPPQSKKKVVQITASKDTSGVVIQMPNKNKVDILLSPQMNPHAAHSAIRMPDNSLMSRNIKSGDLVIVEDRNVTEGDLAVVLTAQGYSFGAIHFQRDSIELEADPDYEVLIFERNQIIKIEGVIMGYCSIEEANKPGKRRLLISHAALKVHPVI